MTKFSPEIFDQICERLSDGESLRDICMADDMPNKATVFRWLANDKTLSDQYARAREVQADALFDDCLAIADQYERDEKTADGATDHINRAKLRIDTRKWMAGKLRPKKYGDKIEVNNLSSDGSMKPVIVQFVSPKSDDNSDD